MPDWMKEFLPIAGIQQSDWIEELYNDHHTIVHTNAPRALMCVAVQSVVGTLLFLHAQNRLIITETTNEKR